MLNKALAYTGWALALIFALAIARENHTPQALAIAPVSSPLAFQPTAPSDRTTIEEIGDSITYGADESLSAERNLNACRGGYRKQIYPWLAAHGYRPVGSVIAGDGPGWDWHCEGHPGATTADLAARYPTFDQGIHPDVALIMIGTNDFGADIPLETSMANMATLWTEIYKQNPSCDLYVSSVIPLYNYDVTPLNAAIAEQVELWHARGYHIHFVDMYHLAKLRRFDYAPSGVHPAASGYAKIARVWESTLESCRVGRRPTY